MVQRASPVANGIRTATDRGDMGYPSDGAAGERVRASSDREAAGGDRGLAAQDRATLLREIGRLERELERAQLDDLTEAYRRGIGERLLSIEMDRARRSTGKFVLAFVDVDGLKRVNDRDGHDAGDRVLQTVVATMRSGLRSYDPLVRYGGDEFLCGLCDADLASARRRFRGIARALARRSVWVSVGLAALNDGDTCAELIERADAALRRIKSRRRSSGRNERPRGA
jgi:diguanylate cyclase (GGDEF)-like protein